MEALFLLIPLSLIALGVAIWIFLRMNASGQFDDAQGPAYSILLDDDDPTGDSRPGQAPPPVSDDSSGKPSSR